MIILEALETKGMLVKKGISVDATIVQSTTRPLSNKKREELEQAPAPSCQIDTDAASTQKRSKKYFGYKGHIGQDVESGLIRKRSFTSARPHDSQQKDNLISGGRIHHLWGSAYSNQKDKRGFFWLYERKTGIQNGCGKNKSKECLSLRYELYHI